MDNDSIKKGLVKIILTLENNHHGCKQEASNIARELLGCKIEHNEVREMINVVEDEDIESVIKSLD
ncbi:hypothetical protein [Thalassotalea crassostreae]|uniref:hypothetical protein n=1 Tax=Thalassotalea crassostreae TaxID=1763536 RepID=UPI00083961A6|nr:hypothetical protein [Thalassotalea crassostreae]